MRHVPRRPDASVNVSRTHPLWEAGTLFVGLGLLLAGLVVVVVFAADLLIRFVPPDTEARWFADKLPVEAALPATADEKAAAALLDELAQQLPDAPYAFRLGVTEHTLPNAFALPGGVILVTRGLLDTVKTENELAFVLGHELGHFRHRDHLRQLARSAVFSVLVAGLGTAQGSETGYTLGDLTMRGFGREQEAVADAFALSLVHQRYGHTNGAAGFFRSVAPADGPVPAWAAYLSTHPAPAGRADALRAQATAAGWPQRGPTRPWPPNQ